MVRFALNIFVYTRMKTIYFFNVLQMSTSFFYEILQLVLLPVTSFPVCIQKFFGPALWTQMCNTVAHLNFFTVQTFTADMLTDVQSHVMFVTMLKIPKSFNSLPSQVTLFCNPASRVWHVEVNLCQRVTTLEIHINHFNGHVTLCKTVTTRRLTWLRFKGCDWLGTSPWCARLSPELHGGRLDLLGFM